MNVLVNQERQGSQGVMDSCFPQALSGDLESQTHSKNIKKTKNFLNFFSFLFF